MSDLDGGWPGHLDLVTRTDDMNALARAVLRSVNDVEAKMGGDVSACTGCELQLTGAVLDVREPIDVELEHFRGVLDAEAIPGAEILIYPDLQRIVAHPYPLQT